MEARPGEITGVAVRIQPIWYRWLHCAVGIVILFGLGMLTAPDMARRLFSLLMYSAPDAMETRFGPDANQYITFAHGVLGAVMASWGLMLLLVLRGPFARGQKGAWQWIAIPFLVWYLADTVFSLFAGFWQNAVLNTALAGLFAVPLAATHRHFRRTD